METTNSGTGVSNVVKVSTSWFGVGLSYLGIHTWSDMAAVVTTVLTLLYIADWIWKKLRGKA